MKKRRTLVSKSATGFGYEFTMLSGSSFFEIDASSKRVLKEIPVENTLPNLPPAIDTFSSAAMVVAALVARARTLAYCGKFCRGSLANVNGLWDFDTTMNSFITQHFPAHGGHGANPFSTPK
jgi:hypothetical protein